MEKFIINFVILKLEKIPSLSENPYFRTMCVNIIVKEFEELQSEIYPICVQLDTARAGGKINHP